MESFKETVAGIKDMRIRGANAIAESGLKALMLKVKELKARNRSELIQKVSHLAKILLQARPTEPLLRNALKYCIFSLQDSNFQEVEKLKQLFGSSAKQFLENIRNAEKKIAEIGKERIRVGVTILTHCHSTTVTSLLRAAKDKRITVICTETRPLYQGRTTVKELIKAGIRTRMIIDSAVRSFIKNVDMVLVGADAITSEGNVINKIGTAQIALIADEARVPFYVASTVYKFSPETALGRLEKIEERSPEEVWPGHPRKLKIFNPSFDVTPRDYIDGIICEYGIIPPFQVPALVMEKFPWIMREL